MAKHTAPEKTKEISSTPEKGKKLFPWRFMDKRRLKRKPATSYVVTMLFPNGTSRTFVIATRKRTFKMGSLHYVLRQEEAYMDLSLKKYHFYYHAHHAVPINREVTAVGDERYFTATPENMEGLLQQKYVEVLVAAQGLAKLIKTILVLAFVQAGLTAIVLFTVWR